MINLTADSKIRKGVRFGSAQIVSRLLSRKQYLAIARSYYRNRWSSRETSSFKPLDDPTKLAWINPRSIIRFTNRPGISCHSKISDIAKVKSGDWDLGGKRVKDTWIYKSFKNRFKKGVRWENTEMYHRYCSRYSKRKAVELCKDYDLLYSSIEGGGYKTQFELFLDKKDPIRSFPYMLTNEITVDIGRNGNPLLVDSKHRAVIAQLLNINRVPVFVLVRHKKYIH